VSPSGRERGSTSNNTAKWIVWSLRGGISQVLARGKHLSTTLLNKKIIFQEKETKLKIKKLYKIYFSLIVIAKLTFYCI
jgi:hypothetical protein